MGKAVATGLVTGALALSSCAQGAQGAGHVGEGESPIEGDLGPQDPAQNPQMPMAGMSQAPDPSRAGSSAGRPAPVLDAGATTDDAALAGAVGCANGQKDVSETGTDCGGQCPACPVGQGCLLDADCESGLCGDGFVCVEGFCDDGEQNGAETAVDCGGGACPGCAVGGACAEPSDCESGECTGGRCTCSPSVTEADCLENSCTPIDDGCGGMVDCTCSDGLTCQQGRCVDLPEGCEPSVCPQCTEALSPYRCCQGSGECGCQGLVAALLGICS